MPPAGQGSEIVQMEPYVESRRGYKEGQDPSELSRALLADPAAAWSVIFSQSLCVFSQAGGLNPPPRPPPHHSAPILPVSILSPSCLMDPIWGHGYALSFPRGRAAAVAEEP